MEQNKIRSNSELFTYLREGNEPEFVFFYGGRTEGKVGPECLSQWYPSEFSEDGKTFKTAEHYMMYRKALLFEDDDAIESIVESPHPRVAKALGRQIKGYSDTLWSRNRFKAVVAGSILKFSENKNLMEYLLSTGDKILVEASPYDKIWGIGLGVDHKAINNPALWDGTNLLGYALMEARDVIKATK